MALSRWARHGRPIRLTYVITDLKVGGVPLHLYRLATSLPRDRVAVRVVTLADEGPVGGMLRQAGVPVQACDARSALDVAALPRLRRILVANRPDLVHSLLFHANTAARLVGPLAGIPPGRIITEIQTVEVERPWHLLVDNLTCRLSAVEVGNSSSVIAHLHRRAHIPMRRLRCELGAVDVERIASTPPMRRDELGVKPDETLLMWCGRFDPVKGFEELLGATAIVLRTHPVRLLLAGDGPYRSAIERLIRVHELGDHVSLLGQRTDLPALLRCADMFVFCSRTEGLPNAVLEAMAAALPVVATNVAGCRDVIEDGRTGVLVAGRPEVIARAVIEVLARPDRGRSLGEAAFRWVSENAAIDGLVPRWVTLYESLLRSR